MSQRVLTLFPLLVLLFTTACSTLDSGTSAPVRSTASAHKGSALSMMVELLAAALTGGNFSFEFDWSQHPGAQTPWTGQLLIVIDPSKSGGNSFAQRSAELVRQMHAVGLERMPGDRRFIERAKSLSEGIPLGAEELAKLRELAG